MKILIILFLSYPDPPKRKQFVDFIVGSSYPYEEVIQGLSKIIN
jgi:hypothetical protein